MNKRSLTVACSMTDSIRRMEEKNLLAICVANPENLNKHLTIVSFTLLQSKVPHFTSVCSESQFSHTAVKF